MTNTITVADRFTFMPNVPIRIETVDGKRIHATFRFESKGSRDVPELAIITLAGNYTRVSVDKIASLANHFTGLRSETDMKVLRLAMKIERSLWESWLAYERECESYRERGYRPHFCEHGTNKWTDYDNICGPCEDGLFIRYGEVRRTQALRRAKMALKSVAELYETVTVLKKNGIDLSPDQIREVIRRTDEIIEQA